MSTPRRFSTSPSGRDTATAALLARPTSATSSSSSPARSAAAARVDGAPAYLVEWGPGSSTRTALPTAEALRAVVLRVVFFVVGVFWLFVLRGLTIDLVRALRTTADIDPAFLEAHARRRRYRPLRWRKDARFGGWVVPELVEGYRACWAAKDEGAGKGTKSTMPVSSDGSATVTGGEKVAAGAPGHAARGMADLMGEPPVRAISEDGDTAAVFSRASLWLGSDGLDVLLVDRPMWADENSRLRKARRGGGGGGGGPPFPQPRPGFVDRRGSLEVRVAEADDTGSLEDDVYAALKAAVDAGESLQGVEDELDYDHWLDFFLL